MSHQKLFLYALLTLLALLPACSDDGAVTPGAEAGGDLAPLDAGVAADLAAADLAAPDLAAPGPHKKKVEDLVKPILDGKWTVGLVVGLISAKGTEVYAFGQTAAGGAAPTQDTLFEIGSISKTFTSLLLARMAEQGQVTLTQPVKALLPAAQVTMPTHGSTPITLEHLSTHVSGLPRMPTNVAPKEIKNPYVDYLVKDLYSFLSAHSLARAPLAKWEYSNLAVGLLGHALALKAGKSFEALLAQLITTPLKLTDTTIKLSSAQAKRFSQGHDHDLVATSAWDFDVLAPCGAVRSTARDMLAYLAAQAGLAGKTTLDKAMAETHKVHYSGTTVMGLGWIIGEGRYVWHNGGTGGFESFAGFDSKTKTGAVVLSNAMSGWSPQTRLGLALLKMMAGETYTAVDLPPTVTVPTATLDTYTGTYQAGSSQLAIKRKGDALYLESAGQSPYRLYARDTVTFYLRVARVGILFTKDSTGKVISLDYSSTAGKSTFLKI